MTLEDELIALETAAREARLQKFFGLADAFDRVAEDVRRDLTAALVRESPRAVTAPVLPHPATTLTVAA